MDSDISAGQARQVAIVGAACRLPGGIVDLDGLWQALRQERNLVSEAPADRFDRERFVDPGLPRRGKSYTAVGGFLDDVASFDADFFGITPKEATRMDPQHRMLLELAVEAMDDAGMPLQALAGSDTSVHVGLSDASYGALQAMQARAVNPYTVTGSALSLAANRLSHFLDLHGPSMAIDTACSSSLVALDRACRTLHEGTSRVALSAGVNVLLNPYLYVGLSQASMLSPTGRCAPFSAAADGFVRAEGGGLVVLKRLPDALADGDRIHGVILGSGANSDGHTPGVALPNPRAQEDLLRQVYTEAGVDPEELVYLEAHGTGTLVGDPAECRSIGRALGARRGTVLPIGSVKSNLGHLESASGMAGLLKALLVLRHRMVPATLHTLPHNPGIDFTALNVAPVAEAVPLPPRERPVVGVNSFGFGGANAHVIVTVPPAAEPAVPGSRDGAAVPRPVIVSARCPQALRAAAIGLSEHLVDADPAAFYDVAYTASRRRELHRHRAVVLAGTPREAARRLAELFAPPAGAEDGQAAPAPSGAAEVGGGAVGKAVSDGRVAFVFSGNGSQWAGMGADLLTADAAFREAVHAVDAVLSPHLGWSVAERLGTVTAEEMQATEVAQPLLFGVQVAVAAALRAQGVVPAAVIGHSVGEVAAAHVAGALSLEQAARVIAERSRAQASAAGSGRMAAVALAPEQAGDVLADHPGVGLAAVNSAGDVTVAGPEKEVLRLAADLACQDTACTVLDLDYAFHSAAMDPLRAPLCEALRGLAPAPTRVPLFSTVTGERAEGALLDAAYWWRNVREPVRFHSAVQAVLADGVDVLVEVGPHPVLRSYLRRGGGERRTPVAVVPTLRRDACGTVALRRTTEAVMAAGGEIDWSVHFPQPGRVADLPAYPWQRSVHWQGSAQDWVRTSGTGALDHPLLGERMPGPHPVWHGAVEPQIVPWLVDHKIAGSVVVPAAGYVEMVMAAGQRSLGGPVEVDRMHLIGPLAVPWADASSVHMQLAVNPEDGRVTITSTDEHSRKPRPHVRARVRTRLGTSPGPVDVPVLRQRCTRQHRADDYYAALNRKRLEYGQAFRVLTELRAGDGEVLADYEHHADAAAFTVHPALLDGALQSGALLLVDKMTDEKTGYLPSAIGSVKVWRTPSGRGFFHVRERSFTHAEVCWDITVMDDDGTVTVELESCRLRRFTHPDQAPALRHRTEMRAAPLPGAVAPPAPLPLPAQLVSARGQHINTHLHAAASLRIAAAIALMKRFRAHWLAEVTARFLPDPGAPFRLADLAGTGVDPGLIATYEHVLGTHEWREVAEPVGEEAWRLTATPRSRALARELLTEHALFGGDLLLLSAPTGAATGQLIGQENAPDSPSGGGSASALEQFFDTSPVCRTYNRICQALVRELVRCWPADRPLRVIEVGAGTGGMTSALLPLLPADRTTYLFTDPSSSLVRRAQQRFTDHDFVRYATYDLDEDPAGHDVAEGGFDLVVAANALHTAKDLASAVRRAATLLTPQRTSAGLREPLDRRAGPGPRSARRLLPPSYRPPTAPGVSAAARCGVAAAAQAVRFHRGHAGVRPDGAAGGRLLRPSSHGFEHLAPPGGSRSATGGGADRSQHGGPGPRDTG
ncbi:polyketide synthase [Streptomyces sp. KN37]|uniref:polyketide synthase n=1 Tax=Streptomyces sp. KN37 TaxID=3090667 RepID=UPI002A7547D6|nr:polyketide synthase [Streptomyces sp. KN37]WPO76677.1 beta-ketoacyl synthase N-terminal-like domain-containing protein [Streptomyces sp. KN37]